MNLLSADLKTRPLLIQGQKTRGERQKSTDGSLAFVLTAIEDDPGISSAHKAYIWR